MNKQNWKQGFEIVSDLFNRKIPPKGFASTCYKNTYNIIFIFVFCIIKGQIILKYVITINCIAQSFICIYYVATHINKCLLWYIIRVLPILQPKALVLEYPVTMMGSVTEVRHLPNAYADLVSLTTTVSMVSFYQF